MGILSSSQAIPNSRTASSSDKLEKTDPISVQEFYNYHTATWPEISSMETFFYISNSTNFFGFLLIGSAIARSGWLFPSVFLAVFTLMNFITNKELHIMASKFELITNEGQDFAGNFSNREKKKEFDSEDVDKLIKNLPQFKKNLAAFIKHREFMLEEISTTFAFGSFLSRFISLAKIFLGIFMIHVFCFYFVESMGTMYNLEVLATKCHSYDFFSKDCRAVSFVYSGVFFFLSAFFTLFSLRKQGFIQSASFVLKTTTFVLFIVTPLINYLYPFFLFEDQTQLPSPLKAYDPDNLTNGLCESIIAAYLCSSQPWLLTYSSYSKAKNKVLRFLYGSGLLNIGICLAIGLLSAVSLEGIDTRTKDKRTLNQFYQTFDGGFHNIVPWWANIVAAYCFCAPGIIGLFCAVQFITAECAKSTLFLFTLSVDSFRNEFFLLILRLIILALPIGCLSLLIDFSVDSFSFSFISGVSLSIYFSLSLFIVIFVILFAQ